MSSHDPSLGAWGTTGLPGAPPAYQGRHRPSRGTTELPRDTTYLSRPPQACQEHHRLVRGTTCLAGAPQACQRHHRVVRGTTVPSRGTSAPQACQGHHRPVRGTTGLPGAPVRDPVSMGRYGYERLSSGLAPVVRLTAPVSMD